MGKIPDTLVSLAMLRACHRSGRENVLESFAALTALLLREEGIKRIRLDDVESLCDSFYRAYGVTVPLHPMVSILGVLSRQGYVERQDADYYTNVGALARLDETLARRDQMTAAWGTALGSLVDFCAAEGVTVNPAEAENALIALFRLRDVHVVAAARGESVLRDVVVSDELTYLAGRWVLSEAEAGSETFGLLARCAAGHLYASAVMLGDATGYSGSLAGTQLYIDTGVLLRLLGVTERFRQSATEQLLIGLSDTGAELNVFEHCIDEAVSLLEGSIIWIDNPRFRWDRATITTRYVVDFGLREDQIVGLIASIPKVLGDFEITRCAAPSVLDDPTLAEDESVLRETLVRVYRQYNPSFNPRKKQQTVDDDVRSIQAIYQLRGGSIPVSLADAKHVLATTAYGLARTAREFERTRGRRSSAIPTCLTDQFVGTIQWLERPVDNDESMTWQLLADCASVLEPPPAMLSQFYGELAKLEREGTMDSAERVALTVDPVVRGLLSSATHNDPHRFVDTTASEVREQYRAHTVAEHEHRLTVANSRVASKEKTIGTYDENARDFARRASRWAVVAAFVVGAGLLLLGVLRSTVTEKLLGIASILVGGSWLAIVRVWGNHIEERFAAALLGTAVPGKDEPLS